MLFSFSFFQSLIIRGAESDNAICCNRDTTFSFKVAEISNPLLLASNLFVPDKEKDVETERRTQEVEV
jgi:hypothetical protein